jgi:hypothetical protein
VDGRSLAFNPNRFVQWKIIVIVSKSPLLVVSRRKPLVSGVAEFNMKHEDPIVSPTLSPYTSVDLGARSLVSGVDCNDPENYPY